MNRPEQPIIIGRTADDASWARIYVRAVVAVGRTGDGEGEEEGDGEGEGGEGDGEGGEGDGEGDAVGLGDGEGDGGDGEGLGDGEGDGEGLGLASSRALTGRESACSGTSSRLICCHESVF